ncbi:hypothetical protein FG385_14880 [Amycolatopsis alkalitolerans]|uniref:Uncharacterized protein n=1 Tax=Amycolatopsis alkalitolerans TaxID=2547244 RepID=A0A5C4M3I3_9PSEU|nr:hypothetical protein FG385_14880 [Amycolatopsis alkalitolerans]
MGSTGSVAACVLALSACGGGQPAPPAAPPDTGVAQGVAATRDVQCGTVPAPGGQRAKVVVQQGGVECAEALTVLTQYFGRVTPAEAASPDGAGPVAVDPWTCASEPASVPAATCSTEDGRQIAAEPAR